MPLNFKGEKRQEEEELMKTVTIIFKFELTSRKPISLSSIWILAISRRFPYKSEYSGGDFGLGGGSEGTDEE